MLSSRSSLQKLAGVAARSLSTVATRGHLHRELPRTVMMIANPTLSSISFTARHLSSDDGGESEEGLSLSDLLEREWKEEEDGGRNDMPASLSDLKATIAESWTIVEDGGLVKMVSNVFEGPQKVILSFHCQDQIDPEDLGLQVPEMGEEEDDDDEEAGEIRFTLTVTKAGQTLVMICRTDYEDPVLESISATSTDAVDALHNTTSGKIPPTEYQGPVLDELDSDLGYALSDFCKFDCGVNADVIAFMKMYSDYKEQTMYSDWLKQVAKIVS